MSFRSSSDDVAARAAAETNIPATCPACHSPAISTTAKSPDANSYWRCAACGEIWNVTRRDGRTGAHAWR